MFWPNFFHNINYTMNGELLILFIILLLALVLCSFLGSSNYLTTEGFTNINGIYSGPNGVKAVVTDNSIVFTSNGNTVTLTKTGSSQTYTGPNGSTATFSSSGQLTITTSQGTTTLTMDNSDSSDSSASSSSPTGTTNYDNYDHYNKISYPTIYYGPNGSTARVINIDGKGKIIITSANGTTKIYYIDTSSSSSSIKRYNGPNGGVAVIATDSNGNQIVKVTGPNGTTVIYTPYNTYISNSQDPTINQPTSSTSNSSYNAQVTNTSSNTYDSSAYYNSLPAGIPASQIPAGQEDLYILKSEVVPPVCPKCPDPIINMPDNFDVSKCPACPPCARCPEPAFDCKKVPNYNAFNPDYMPVPVLTDFSGFGM